MKYIIMSAAGAAAIALAGPANVEAQDRHVHLHVNTRWEECAFQLDPALTQAAWRQFAEEAGVVTYFRPLRGARPMGAGNFDISILQSTTGIDDADAAWNDTFVHPDSTHWLFEGSGLSIPSLMVRGGITDRIDVGAYYTESPKANYGFAGGQVQYSVVDEARTGISGATRLSVVKLFGPEDVDFTAYGLDLLVSRDVPLFAGRAAVTPYAGISGYLSSAHEKSAVVTLADENVFGSQAMVGAEARYSVARVAVEFSSASVQSRTIRIGLAF